MSDGQSCRTHYERNLTFGKRLRWKLELNQEKILQYISEQKMNKNNVIPLRQSKLQEE